MKIWEILKPENIGKIYTSEDACDSFKVVERRPFDGTRVALNTIEYDSYDVETNERIEDAYHLDFILNMNFEEVE